ncbi:hypothetical protein [Erythrobacter sp. JK5]|uniref:hypothetical protein n=1 Tax=Erythrobacter sp. JK5 TaxID=2829500 RepID=UPI001BAA5E22|nr:hypothetical protein [Erythrobacter sp. JK5]QUL36474.1 hypothetical protein KDC96_08415 [Erythrobacter sp. JK5]
MNIVLSLVMLVALALIAGAIVYWRRTGELKQPALMVLLALVAIANVLIWTLPDASGVAPVDQVESAGAQDTPTDS